MLEEINVDSVLEKKIQVLNDKAVPSFRPSSFNDYIGQLKIKAQLEMMISSAKSRKCVLDHVLFFGLPGMGKTSLAQIIADMMGFNLIVTSGQALEKTGDVASILASLKHGDFLFIDEIHRLKPKIEEMLYTAMEDYAIDIVLGKGPTAKIMRLDIEKFTLIGATTKLHQIANPLKDRFGITMQLDDYTINDIVDILKVNCKKLEIEYQEEALKCIAKCSRGTPRVAIHFLKRCRDLMIHSDKTVITEKLALELLEKVGLDLIGLTRQDRSLVKKLYYDFNAGPIGLSTLAVALNDDPINIEDTVEPFLIRLGLLKRTHRGRQLTSKGIEFAKNMV